MTFFLFFFGLVLCYRYSSSFIGDIFGSFGFGDSFDSDDVLSVYNNK
jgi:hypothetical protein